MQCLRRVTLRILVLALAALLSVEFLLQGASLFTESRDGAAGHEARIRVLCMGDSHTYGAFVPERESYPAHLQAALEATSPGVYSVINLGVPGMSSTQVKNRLATHVARYDPAVVVLWAGVNDAWNVAERSGARWLAGRLDALLSRLRTYRMVKIWSHDLALERAADAPVRADGVHQTTERSGYEEGRGALWTLRHGGVVETVDNRREAAVAGGDSEGRVYAAHRASVEWLRSAGIPVILIRYPLQIASFGQANRAISRVAEELEVPLVEAADAVERVPPEQVKWLWGAHPNGPVYREVALDASRLVAEITGGE